MNHDAEATGDGRRLRPATAADAERHGERFTWLKPDGWRAGFRALVLEIDDPRTGGAALIGVGRIGPNLVHPGRDLVEIEIDPAHRRRGHGTALIRELGRYSVNPLSDKVVPGSERDMFLRTLGAYTYLSVPLLGVEVAAASTRRWCEAVRDWAAGEDVTVLPWTELPRQQVVEALVSRYHWQHASWSPTASRDVLRPVVGQEFYDQTVLAHSWATMREGRIMALVDVYDEPVGAHREGSIEAVDPAAPQARADVALCLAAALEDLAALGCQRLDLDNHPTDPHAAPLLMTLGRVERDPVDLVEIPSRLTARLREA